MDTDDSPLQLLQIDTKQLWCRVYHINGSLIPAPAELFQQKPKKAKVIGRLMQNGDMHLWPTGKERVMQLTARAFLFMLFGCLLCCLLLVSGFSYEPRQAPAAEANVARSDVVALMFEIPEPYTPTPKPMQVLVLRETSGKFLTYACEDIESGYIPVEAAEFGTWHLAHHDFVLSGCPTLAAPTVVVPVYGIESYCLTRTGGPSCIWGDDP